MKNKDKYAGFNLIAKVQFKIDGCGKKIMSSREIVIIADKLEIERIKTQDVLVDVFHNWLESEEKSS